MAQTSTALFKAEMVSGWMHKRKSKGLASRFVAETNKRFFVLDFGSQLFYYSHKEDDRHVSMPIPFRELVAVEGNFRPAAFSSSWSPFFLLRTRSKSMELQCESLEDADYWIKNLHVAISMGAGDLPISDASTSLGSASSSPRSDNEVNRVLTVGQVVCVSTPFRSDTVGEIAMLSWGQQGTVMRIDADGDAYINFGSGSQWVSKKDFAKLALVQPELSQQLASATTIESQQVGFIAQAPKSAANVLAAGA